MLPDPVELARSWHGQEVWEGEEVEMDFEKAWHLQGTRAGGRALDHAPLRPGLLQYGRVAAIGSQLETVIELYPREQVRIILLEDMATEPARVYRDTLAFLDVPYDGRNEFPVVNLSRIPRGRFARILHHPPQQILRPYVYLKRTMGLGSKRLGLRNWLRESSLLSTKQNSVPAAFRTTLIEHFEPEIEKVERILNRSLPEWRR